MIKHITISDTIIFRFIRYNKDIVAGNERLKIYGQLNCASGKRMKKENRVFFENEAEAKQHGFRPCGHCMRLLYNSWKESITS